MMTFTFKRNSATMLCTWHCSRSSFSNLIANAIENKKIYFYCNAHGKTMLSIEVSDGGTENKFTVNTVLPQYSIQVSERESPFGGTYRDVYFRVSKKQGRKALQNYLTDVMNHLVPGFADHDIEAVVIFSGTERMNIDIAEGITETEMRVNDQII